MKKTETLIAALILALFFAGAVVEDVLRGEPVPRMSLCGRLRHAFGVEP